MVVQEGEGVFRPPPVTDQEYLRYQLLYNYPGECSTVVFALEMICQDLPTSHGLIEWHNVGWIGYHNSCRQTFLFTKKLRFYRFRFCCTVLCKEAQMCWNALTRIALHLIVLSLEVRQLIIFCLMKCVTKNPQLLPAIQQLSFFAV